MVSTGTEPGLGVLAPSCLAWPLTRCVTLDKPLRLWTSVSLPV